MYDLTICAFRTHFANIKKNWNAKIRADGVVLSYFISFLHSFSKSRAKKEQRKQISNTHMHFRFCLAWTQFIWRKFYTNDDCSFSLSFNFRLKNADEKLNEIDQKIMFYRCGVVWKAKGRFNKKLGINFLIRSKPTNLIDLKVDSIIPCIYKSDFRLSNLYFLVPHRLKSNTSYKRQK